MGGGTADLSAMRHNLRNLFHACSFSSLEFHVQSPHSDANQGINGLRPIASEAQVKRIFTRRQDNSFSLFGLVEHTAIGGLAVARHMF